MTEVLQPQPRTNDVAARRRRRWVWLAAGVVAGGAAFVLYWFQPQKLFLDDRVDEAVPAATASGREVSPSVEAAAARAAKTTAPTELLELARGDFVSLDHGTSGRVRVMELPDGTRVVRLEDLNTSNGPDLYVYLSTNPASGDEGAFDDDVINLGRLKANQGNQNYDLPAGVDLARFASLVVWCDRFDSAFGAADLMAV